MKLTVIGTGYVGVVSAAVYASFGHQVTGLDVDAKKVAALKEGKVPFYEPHLEELLLEQQAAGRLRFTTEYNEAIPDAEIVIIAVGTPSAADGQADLKYIKAATESLAPLVSDGTIVVIKSTVPPGTLKIVDDQLKSLGKTRYYTASLPEFLREGSAVNDTLHPDRVVIGASDAFVFDKLEELHKPLNAPVVKITPESAQMAKYAANNYLATRITFANQIADLCDKNGADVQEVIAAIGLDQRIGNHYWYPGFGYGGSCFPKDVKELAAYSRAVGEANNLFNKVNELNEGRIPRLLELYGQKIGGWAGKKVAILGLSFKPNTDDMREAPSTKVVPELIKAGAEVVGFDPRAEWSVFMPNTPLNQVEDIKTAVAEADVIMALIEWPEILSCDFGALKLEKQQWFIDARNQFTPDQVVGWGYAYIGIGRPSRE